MMAGKAGMAGYRRYEIAILCALGTVLCYADRTNIGVAIPSFQPDHAVQGHILSAFFYGYIATQIIGAHSASRYGPKVVLLIGVITWSFFDLLTVPFAKTTILLWLTRVGMGFGEGIIFPCMHSLALAWYPASERSRLTGLVSSGMDLGTITAMIISPWLMEYYDYPSIFITFGCLSALWVVVFFIRGANTPEVDPFIHPSELVLIQTTRIDPLAPSTRLDFFSPSIIAIYSSHFAYNYGWYVLLGWIPQYLRLHLNLELATSGVAAAVPYFCGYLGVLWWGYLSDKLLAHGIRLVSVRKLMNGFGLIGFSITLYLLRYTTSAYGAVAMLAFTLFLSRAATAGYWINMLDVAPTHAGHLMAVSNTIGTIPGIFGNIVTGEILHESGNWDLVFLIASIILFIGGVIFQLFASDVPQEIEVSPTDRTALLTKQTQA